MRDRELAEWMLEEVNRDGVLTQDRVIREILETTGGEFACINRGVNWAVSRVLREAFRKLAGDSVTWDEAHRCWRKAVPPAEEPRS